MQRRPLRREGVRRSSPGNIALVRSLCGDELGMTYEGVDRPRQIWYLRGPVSHTKEAGMGARQDKRPITNKTHLAKISWIPGDITRALVANNFPPLGALKT